MNLAGMVPISEENVLLIFGIAIAMGFFAGRFFHRIGIPEVVGFILMGVLLGESLVGIFSTEILDKSRPLILLALAFIGFNIGGHFRIETVKRLGKSISTILIFESLMAFILVTLGIYLYTKKLHLALIFGAISSATAPAATVDVLWEYRSKGILTTTLLAIVGLDDAVSIILYSFASSYAKIFFGESLVSWLYAIGKPLLEIFGSVALGSILGIFLAFSLKKVTDRTGELILTVALITIGCGISEKYGLSCILTSMLFGVSYINLAESDEVFNIVQVVVPPIYVIFFVFVGARLKIGLLAKMGAIGLIYLILRSLGKMTGATLGSWISGASENVRKYLNLCLFSQAGVAVGLALAIYHDFATLGPAAQEMSLLVINVITATTLVLQIIGPPSVKYAIVKAGEVGKAPAIEI